MQRLGVGRTPVREAVQRLQRDGFVTVIPRRGTLVSEISITDLAAIYEVRKQLESWASRVAAERATDEDHSEAPPDGRPRGAHRPRRLPDAAHGRPPHPPLRLPHDQEPFLAETLDQYQNLSLRILHVASTASRRSRPGLDDVVNEQRTVLDAVCRGDGDTAERVAIEHISTFERAIREII